MKRPLPWILLGLALLWVVSNLRPAKNAPGAPNFSDYSKIPVLSDGRIKPLDTVGRNALLIIRGKQTLRLEDGTLLDANHWLADVLYNAPEADKYPAFVINNPEVLGLFGWQQADRKYFSYTELEPFLEAIDAQGQKAEEVEAARRTPFHTAIFNLRNALMLYQRLKESVRPGSATDFKREVEGDLKAVPAGLAAMENKNAGKPYDKEALIRLEGCTAKFQALAQTAYILPIPPGKETPSKREEWLSLGESLLQALQSGSLDAVAGMHLRLGDAYRNGRVAAFNEQVRALTTWMASHDPNAAGRASFEALFNRVAPFYQAMVLYVLSFLLLCGFWIRGTEGLRLGAFLVILLSLAIHTFGLIARMYLQGRPPVTNLYSSAIFIGWGTVILGLFLEKIFRDGIGAACASAIGFATLIIAHHLATSGDTLEMLQAVLDTNFWLATHVVTITIGYSAMFFAGTLAMIYVFRSLFSASFGREAARLLARMIYGVVCFATLFSFVGTVLGGIWADQSWGRFWGWDPKENGALLIVLWCALILHARWGGYIRDRGLVVMALFGNVITSFSWFGVNMLGVGLHSYGFMNKAVPWLAGFIFTQLLLMGLALLPQERHRGGRGEIA